MKHEILNRPGTELLENFDIADLDPFETMEYKHHTEIAGMSKAEALQCIINTVEGDYSQLSEGLQNIAILQDQLNQIKAIIF